MNVGCPSQDPDGGGDGDGDGETAAEDDYEAPVFVDPASGVVSLFHDSLEDPVLRVTDVVVGRTRLEIDGRSVGTLESAGPTGHLEAESLRLRIEGGMVEGTHYLRLVTPGTTAPQASADVEVRILPASLPKLTFELGANTVAQGEHVGPVGTGERGLLWIVAADGPQDATLSMLRADGTNWSAADVRTLALPGHVVDDGPSGGAVGASVRLPENEGEDTRVRVAWRVSHPGARADAVELTWGEDQNTAGEITTLLAAADVPSAEWASIGRPAFVGGHVAIEVYAPADTEQALPGDEALFAVRWPDDGDPMPAQRVTFGQLLDLDLVGRAIDLSREDVALGLRVDGRRLAVMRWDAGSALPQLIGGDLGTDLPTVKGDALGTATVLGAFGSQTAAAVQGDGDVRVVVRDTSVGRGHGAHPDAGDLPKATPSGPPASTIVLGTPLFLVPYANTAEVAALLVDGDETRVQILAGLYCDEIALPASAAANSGGKMAFACVQGGDVRLGALFAGKGD